VKVSTRRGLRQPHTSRLLSLTQALAQSLRLTHADRLFLRDLARVRLISADLANVHHYARLKSGAERPLSRLVKSGLLTEKQLRVPGHGQIKTYEFASQQLARTWGGSLPVTGAKRTNLHELITSGLYFELGRPTDFRLAADFDHDDVQRCGTCPYQRAMANLFCVA